MGDVAPNKKSLATLVEATVKKMTSGKVTTKGSRKPKAPKGSGKGKKSSAPNKVSSPRYHPYTRPNHLPAECKEEAADWEEVCTWFGLLQEEAEELQRQRQREGYLAPLLALALEWRRLFDNDQIQYVHPLSWPDWIIDEIPTRFAIIILTWTLVPLSLYNITRARHYLHVGPNIDVDEEALYLFCELSLGYKFLLYLDMQPKLIMSAWNDFKERLRWQCFFAKLMLTNEEYPAERYDPDYAVLKEQKEAPKGDFILDATLDEGEKYVYNVVTSVPIISKRHHPLNVFVKRLHKYLDKKGYVVLPTDKNLGCSVVMKEWFIDSTQKLLADRENYKPLSVQEHCQFISEKI